MTGRRISDLPWPLSKFRISRLSSKFETKQRAAEEDRKRARCLRRLAKKDSGDRGRRAARLADRLDPSVTPRRPRTLASSRYWRSVRIRIVGGLLALAKADHKTLRAFTIIRDDWSFDASELPAINPDRLMNAFRSQLVRRGALQASGWLFAAYHGEYNPVTGRFQGHIHGFATGEMAVIVDGLRRCRAYRSSRSTGVDASIVDPVRITRKPITDLAYTLSYALKSYWPEHREGPTGARKVRLPEPLHSHFLLWLHKRQPSELILLMGLSIRRKGLVQNK